MGIRICGISGSSGTTKKYRTSGCGIKKVSGSSSKVKQSSSIFGPKISGDEDYSYLQPLEPHPEVFKIVEAIQGSRFLYLVVKYPHCTNFEGNKVILMKDTLLIDVLHAKILDPHFYDENKIIARFRPDAEGKKLAKLVAGIQDEK